MQDLFYGVEFLLPVIPSDSDCLCFLGSSTFCCFVVVVAVVVVVVAVVVVGVVIVVVAIVVLSFASLILIPPLFLWCIAAGAAGEGNGVIRDGTTPGS